MELFVKTNKKVQRGNKDMGIRFALDIGVASVGWAVVNDEYVVLESGVNIFPCADASPNFEAVNIVVFRKSNCD